MKKIQTWSIEKVLVACGFSLALALAGLWSYNQNILEAQNLSRVHSGISTCFARVTQTFTAAMIKDLNSPYLKRDFMSLSDECLREGVKAVGVNLSFHPKAQRFFNDLVSETFWFHEKVTKVLASNPLASGNSTFQSITEKFEKIEGLKFETLDQLDAARGRFQDARGKDIVLIASTFLLFLLSLSVLGARELGGIKAKHRDEQEAISLLNIGHMDASAQIDRLIARALKDQGLVITSQVFSDYHERVLEKLAIQGRKNVEIVPEKVAEEPAPEVQGIMLKKILNAQGARLNARVNVSEAKVVAEEENLAQVIQTIGMRLGSNELKIEGEIQKQNYIIKLEAFDVCLNAHELEYSANPEASFGGVDTNVIIAVDLARQNGMRLEIKNKINAEGGIQGAQALITLPLIEAHEEPARTLVQVIKGKKRDLAKNLRQKHLN